MTIIRPNSISGINSITAKNTDQMKLYDSNGAWSHVRAGIITASSFSGSITGTTGNFGGDVTISGDLGVGGTITYEDVARVDATGISTFREGFKLGPLAGIALTAYKDGSIRSTGIITASSFVGDGSGLTGAGPSLANGANNRVITASSATALNGESNLIYDGTTLNIDGNVSSTTQFSGLDGFRIHNANGSAHNVTADMYFTAGTGSSNRGAAIGVQFTSAASGNDLYFATNGGNVTSTNTLTERLRITSAGYVGINETSPEEQLHITHTSAPGIQLEATAGGPYKSLIKMGGNDMEIRGSSGNLEFYTGNADGDSSSERLRITSDGKVGISTTIPATPLHVHGDVLVHGNIYGGVGRKNMIDNGDFTCKERYQNSGFAGNDHSYGYVTDRFQNRGGLSHWRQSTNVPTGKGFIYSAKVTNGTGGALQQSIELDRKGHAGIYQVGTFWCVSVWSTQPINTSSNNGFCQDLGSTNYIALTLRTPSSGNAYSETGESAAGTATGTFKRYYQVYEVTSAPHANNHTLSFGWAFAHSGSGTNEITGIQVEQVANASCKPTPYEHVTRAEQQRRCHRYSYRWSDGGRLINGYKRHDDDVHFNFWLPQPMSPYTVSNGGGSPIGAYAWDVGVCTNMGGDLGGTVSNVRIVEYREGCNWVMIMFDYSAGGNNVVIPSWEGMQFEINTGPF